MGETLGKVYIANAARLVGWLATQGGMLILFLSLCIDSSAFA
jgi:hypothetical protein